MPGCGAESGVSKHPKLLLQTVLKLPLLFHNLLPAQTFKHHEKIGQNHITRKSYILTVPSRADNITARKNKNAML